MTAEMGTSVTVQGMSFDDQLVSRARQYGELLVRAANSPCHIGFRGVPRLGSEPDVEVTISLEVHGAPIWAITSDADSASALRTAFLRAIDRVATAIDWGGSVDLGWRAEHPVERAW